MSGVGEGFSVDSGAMSDVEKMRGWSPGWRFFLLLGAAVVISVGSFFYDTPVRAAIVESQGKDWRKTADHRLQSAVSRYGDWPQLMLVGALALGLAAATRRPDWQRVMVAAIVASTFAGVLANASRLTTGRTRPRESPKIEAGWYGPYHDGRILIGNPAYNAFPSGHTATAVGFAAPILFAKPILGIVVFAGALAVAWSRMALGAHNLSDVVVATLLGLFVGYFVLRWITRNGDQARTWAVAKWTAWRARRRG